MAPVLGLRGCSVRHWLSAACVPCALYVALNAATVLYEALLCRSPSQGGGGGGAERIRCSALDRQVRMAGTEAATWPAELYVRL